MKQLILALFVLLAINCAGTPDTRDAYSTTYDQCYSLYKQAPTMSLAAHPEWKLCSESSGTCLVHCSAKDASCFSWQVYAQAECAKVKIYQSKSLGTLEDE